VNLTAKKILITGAGGFLGSALTTRLSAEGAQVRALVRQPSKAQHLAVLPGVELFVGDITNPIQMQGAVAGCEIVIHGAAALRGKLPAQMETNLGGTHNLAIAAAQAGVSRFVHVSSIAVYGYHVRGAVDESTLCSPGNVPYNISKREAEKALLQIAHAHNLAISINRPGMIYGASSSFWTENMARLAKRQPTPFIGNGSGRAHIIHISDVVDLLLQQATHPQAVGEIFNCVSDPSPLWREFLGAYMQLFGHDRWLALPQMLAQGIAPALDVLLRLKGEPQDLADIIRYGASDTQFSMQKARERLGWSPKVSLESGIHSCIPYLKELQIL
jgi:nucleoside-diphosphate-sugar epimerase